MCFVWIYVIVMEKKDIYSFYGNLFKGMFKSIRVRQLITRFHIQETRIIRVLLYAIDFPAVCQAAEEKCEDIHQGCVGFFFNPSMVLNALQLH